MEFPTAHCLFVCLQLNIVTISEILIIEVCSGAALLILNMSDLCEIMTLHIVKFLQQKNHSTTR